MEKWLAAMLMGLAVVALPTLAEDKKETPKKETPKAPAQKTYVAAGKIAGKVTKVDTKEMTIEIEFKAGRSNKKEELKLNEDVKIRQLSLPEQYDENNKPKPYTPAEKAKLKGDNPKLPGYTAELSKLAAGQIVELELGKNKPAPGSTKKKDKDVVVPEELPFVTMVIIAKEEMKANDKKK